MSELPRPPLKSGSVRALDSSLAQVAALFRTRGAEAALAFAAEHGLKTRSVLGATEIAAVVEMSDPAAFGAIASRHGLTVTSTYKNLFEVNVPLQALETLVTEPTVRSVAPPARVFPLVVSEGVASINATAWHDAGIRGAGAKVAIVDVGFSGYSAKLGSELPSSVNTSCSQSILENGEPHGTAVTEIVYDVAPEAQLYLVAISSVVQIGNAVTCLIGQGVHVVNASIGAAYDGPGNGTGTFNSIINSADAGGIVWVNAAGNYRRSHWAGPWTDANPYYDANGLLHGWLDFAPSVEVQAITVTAGSYVQATLRWNDAWGGSCNDYDLYLMNAAFQVIARSENFQTCSQNPREQVNYVPGVSGTYYLRVHRWLASGLSSFDLMVDSGFSISHQVFANSLTNPADNASPGMISVGAFNNSTQLQEPFSSEGPTTDGRMKPDIAGPDRVTTSTYGTTGFAGTSASTPHVAGAAALVNGMNPALTPAQIKAYLAGRAVDAGEPGPDNQYGVGRLWLGAAPPVAHLVLGMTDTPDPTVIGGDITYALTVTNGGPAAAGEVTVVDTLPATVTFVSATPSAGTCSGTATVTCSLGTVANGGSASVTIVVTPTAQGTVTNTAVVWSATTFDPNFISNTATVTTTVNATAIDLAMSVAASPNPVPASANVTFTSTLTNLGPSQATGVITSSNWSDSGATFVSSSISSPGGFCQGPSVLDPRSIFCWPGALPRNSSVTIQIVLRAPATESAVVQMTSQTWAFNEPELNAANNSATAQTTIGPASADLSLTMADSSDPVTFGGQLTYQLTVTNHGPSPATGVTATLALPAGTAFVSATATQGSCSGTATVNCGLGSLANGATATVAIVVSAPSVLGELTAVASVSATEADPNSFNNDAAESTTPSAFADVLPSDWAYSQIAALLSRGITTGCYWDPSTGERRYCPNNGVTRAQMAAFLIRTLGLTEYANPTPSFSDAPIGYWAYGWIERLYEQAVTTGCYSDGVERRYCPENLVPRDQMAVFLMRARALTQLNSATPTFSDVPSGYWAYGMIERLYEQGVTTGCYWDGVERRYCPTNNVTRREMAVFIIRNWP